MNRQIVCMGSLVLAALLFSGCAEESKPGRYYQLSSINAPLKNSDVLFTDLKWQGDFGYGAVETLDGEMIALDGRFYQAGKDGRVTPIDRFTPSPFAVLTFFKASRSADWDQPLGEDAVKQQLDALLGSRKVPCAILIEGEFDRVQHDKWELKKTTGTIVGFWLPDYMNGMNHTGYQFHYLSADRTQGGLVIGFQPRKVRVAIDPLATIHVQLPKEK